MKSRVFFPEIVVAAALLTMPVFAQGQGQSGDTTPNTGYTYPVGTPYTPDLPSWTTAGANGVSTGSVWIRSAISTLNLDGGNLLSNPLPATNAAGIFDGNDNPYSFTGSYLDGILNGATQSGSVNNGDDSLNALPTLFDPGAFITDSQLQSLDDDGILDDPGWVSLYKAPTGFFALNLGFNLSDYIDINIGCGADGSAIWSQGCQIGTWSIRYKTFNGETIVDALESTRFGDSFFDHLAVSFKQGSEFIVFDFDFNLINDFLPDGSKLDLQTPYNLAGGFNVDSYFVGDAMSHMVMSVRDPANTSDVPVPAPLALLAAGLLGLSFVRRPNSR